MKNDTFQVKRDTNSTRRSALKITVQFYLLLPVQILSCIIACLQKNQDQKKKTHFKNISYTYLCNFCTIFFDRNEYALELSEWVQLFDLSLRIHIRFSRHMRKSLLMQSIINCTCLASYSLRPSHFLSFGLGTEIKTYV